jgi:choline dehydrogenase
MRRLMAALRLCWQLATAPEIMQFAERIPFTEEMITSDEAMEAVLRASVSHTAHASGTAKMGPASDPLAVVDQYGRVYGVENLRVVDASIMPNIPRANTNLTCMMIGERVAGWMREEAPAATATAALAYGRSRSRSSFDLAATEQQAGGDTLGWVGAPP